MRKLIGLVFFLLCSFTLHSKATQINISDSGYQSSYFCLTQLYNGIPKYCGAVGTYTHKHIPVAIEKNGNYFEVFSNNENTGGDPDKTDLVIYLVKNYVEKVKIHTELDWDDAHTNASIDIDGNGYVYVQVSSRGLGHKYRSGHLFKSTSPYSTTMTKLKGTPSHGDFNQGYPQLHYTGNENRFVLFTRYRNVNGKSMRELWVDKNGTEYKLAEGGHYQVSWRDRDAGITYTAFNYHPNNDLDKRSNIHIAKNYYGNSNWYNLEGELLTLPLAENDPRTLVYNSEAQGTYIYLKDIVGEEVGLGSVRVLFTESTSADPTQGTRETKELSYFSENNINFYSFGTVNHNYSAATYLTGRFAQHTKYVLVNGNNGIPYFGGDIKVFKKDFYLGWTYQTATSDNNNYSYVRRVRGAEKKAVASKGVGDIDSGNTHVRIAIID